MSSAPAAELSRTIKISDLGSKPLSDKIIADKVERLALARRFNLPEITALKAKYELQYDGERINCNGVIDARIKQLCSISGKEFPVQISEKFQIVFVKKSDSNDDGEETELAPEDCDIMEYEAEKIDIGEAISQSFFLSVDPYPRGPDAGDASRRKGLISEEEAGPFGALAGLKDKLQEKNK